VVTGEYEERREKGKEALWANGKKFGGKYRRRTGRWRCREKKKKKTEDGGGEEGRKKKRIQRSHAAVVNVKP